MDWTVIVSIVVSGIAALAGGFWLKAKGKFSAIGSLLKESYEVVAKVNAILEDDKITKEEVEQLKAEAEDVKEAFFALIGK